MLLFSILSRPSVSKFAAAVFIATQLLGWVTCARAGDLAGTAVPPPAPPPNSRTAVRRALREFDRFLDHHPLLEEQLRLNPHLAASTGYLTANPEFGDFLHANPNVMAGLQTYPRYFLNRALLRQASTPVSFAELAPFKELFQAEPKLEHELTVTPEAIRDPKFLASHPVLHEMLKTHPALARGFLPSTFAPGIQ